MRPAIVCLPGLLIGLALAGCDRQKAVEPQANQAATATVPAYPSGRLDRSHRGTAAPDVLFEDGEGQPVRLSVFRGRPLLVNLWATWCGPCVVEMPSLDSLALRAGPGIEVVAVSQDLDGRRKVSDFFAARDFRRLEPYLDPEMRLMPALGLDTLPTTILYDAQGREVWRMIGMADWESDRAVRLLAEAGAAG